MSRVPTFPALLLSLQGLGLVQPLDLESTLSKEEWLDKLRGITEDGIVGSMPNILKPVRSFDQVFRGRIKDDRFHLELRYEWPYRPNEFLANAGFPRHRHRFVYSTRASGKIQEVDGRTRIEIEVRDYLPGGVIFMLTLSALVVLAGLIFWIIAPGTGNPNHTHATLFGFTLVLSLAGIRPYLRRRSNVRRLTNALADCLAAFEESEALPDA